MPFLFLFLICWRLITLRYCSGFCHTLTWISHGYTTCHFLIVVRTLKIYFVSNFQIYIKVLSTIVTVLYIPELTSVCTLWPASLHLPYLPALATTILLCFYQFGFVLDSTYKWYHVAFVFLWLISLNIMPLRPIHVTNGRIYFLLMAV